VRKDRQCSLTKGMPTHIVSPRILLNANRENYFAKVCSNIGIV
jgi:hypothetical protein